MMLQTFFVLLALWLVCMQYGCYGALSKDSVQSAAGKDLFTQQFGEAEPGVWPPPPRVQP